MYFRVIAVLALAFVTGSLAASTNLPLTQVVDAPLPGRLTRWDYASLDRSSGLLFLAHLGDGVVTVFDVRSHRVVADIAGVSGVHGVLSIPELGRVYASATDTNEAVAIDAKTFKVVARIPTGEYPDGLAYAPEVHYVYVSDEHSGTETVIDVRTNARVATIKIGREVGNTQYDSVSRHVFVTEQVANELVEIDPATNKIVSRSGLPGCRGSHGLYIDAPVRAAYIACEGNDTLLVFDLISRKVTSSFRVGSGPDVLAFDPSLEWLYVASEAGTVSLFKRSAGTLSKLGESFIGPNAHTVAIDPATHRAYFPLKDMGGKNVLRVMEPKDR